MLENIFAFSPNRDTLGGTSYLLIHPEGNILIDCPSWHEFNREFCFENGGVKYLFLTNRDGISKDITQIKKDLHCDLIIQEQEAYLLPNQNPITFLKEDQIYDDCQLIWTSGYSPASSCLYFSGNNGVLFSGRHLLPIGNNQVTALKMKKTFHYPRQLRNVKLLCHRFSENNLNYICPGANTGYLRGKGFIDNAYAQIKRN
ncbi:MAG: MBL fold metallo-hydrolase [Geminocystis sp. GBBB08]|nr:MBL fold metallo-hydrolase [Geminocystis sp. GBBB08]